MSLVAHMKTSGLISGLDVHFASLVHELAKPAAIRSSGSVDAPDATDATDAVDVADVIAATAALLSRERSAGHPCIHIDDWAGHPLGAERATLPEAAAWRDALAKSELVGEGEAATPLVRDPSGRLYLYRYWQAEQRVAACIRERAGKRVGQHDLTALAPTFRTLFDSASEACDDSQAIAAVIALTRALAVVSGGPGTGKTSTVSRVLALLLAAEPGLRVGVTAPTGKAAARLAETIAGEVERRAGQPGRWDAIPCEASTIHRLLGVHRRDGSFRHDAATPLPLDVVVVDEASMVDLSLMDALLQATRPDARIILLGDRDQLASVEAGYVFADICKAAAGTGNHRLGDAYSAEMVATYERLSGRVLPTETAASPLRDCAVELRRNYRFGPDSAIGRVAAAIRDGNTDDALAVLCDDAHPQVALAAHAGDPATTIAKLADDLASVIDCHDPREALAALANLRILCATRVGRWGTASLNLAVEEILRRSGHITSERWYRGRPIMITTNDYQVGLFNGDVGVCWNGDADDPAGRARDTSSSLCAWFSDGTGGVRPVSLSRLPAHETAWAMTVHKSQGSEFDSVVIVLPADDAEVCTRELLYTAVTRARQHVSLVASAELLRTWTARPAARRSGLADLLLEA